MLDTLMNSAYTKLNITLKYLPWEPVYGVASMSNRGFQLDNDEKSICYSATINYVRTYGQATEGLQK